METDAALADRYRALRAKKKEMDDAHDAAVKPYSAALEKIEAYFVARLDATGQKSMPFGNGTTVYRAETLRPKMVNRAALITYVLEQGGSTDVFTNSVSKDYVQEHIDQHGKAPPGIEVEYVVNARFRKS